MWHCIGPCTTQTSPMISKTAYEVTCDESPYTDVLSLTCFGAILIDPTCDACEAGDDAYTGSCGGLEEKVSEEWCDDLCYAKSSSDCCKLSTAGIVVVIIIVLAICGGIACCIYCCATGKCCCQNSNQNQVQPSPAQAPASGQAVPIAAPVAEKA